MNEKPEEIHEYYSDSSIGATEETPKEESNEISNVIPDHEVPSDIELLVGGPATMSECFSNIKEVTITEAEKQNFLTSVATNKPYLEEVSLYNGVVTATMNVKTQEVQRAIYEAVDRTSDDNVTGDWTNKLRIYTLYFQLERLNGVAVVPFEGVIDYTFDDEGKETAPEWIKKANALVGNIGEPVQIGLYAAVVRLEIKYDYLVSQADNQDFWEAGDSTFNA